MSERVRSANPLALALFWLGIQAVWGAILGISLQSRTIELSAGSALLVYGKLATTGAVVAAIVQVFIGFWSDARRRRSSRRIEFYTIGALGGAVSLLLFYDAGTLFALTLAYVALQASLNVAIGPYQAIIPDFVERLRTGIASSWMAALQSIGNAVGALAASFIANAKLLASVLGGLLLVTCAVTSFHARGLPLREPERSESELRITRPFVDLFVSRALIYIGFYTLLGYLLFYVEAVLGATSLAGARQQTGILIVTFTVVGAAGAALAARPSDRLDKRLVATIGASAFIAALAIFIVSNAFLGVAAATLIAGLGWGVFLVADWAIACRLLPPGAMAASMGIWNLAIVLPQIAAPAITTAVLAQLHLHAGSIGPRVAFALALVETVAGISWLWRLPRCAIEQ